METMAARPDVDRGVAGLLGEVDRRLPAPVGEDTEQESAAECRSAGPERVEPVPRRGQAAERAVPGQATDERDHGEHEQGEGLGQDQPVLQPRRQLRAEHADPGHQQHERHGQHQDDGRVVGQLVEADGAQGEDDAHVGQRADDEDPGHRDGPAADPAEPRPHRTGDPGERRPAVGVDPVERGERGRDQQHRHERRQEHARCVDPGEGHEGAQDRREGVGRRRRGEPDHQGVDEADRPRPEGRLVLGKNGGLYRVRTHATVIAALGDNGKVFAGQYLVTRRNTSLG